MRCRGAVSITRSADTPSRPSVDIHASRPGRPKCAAASHLQQNPRKWRSALHQVDHTQLDGFWSQMRCRRVLLLASRISVPSPATPCTLFTPNGAPRGLISRICLLSFAGANTEACLRIVTRSHVFTLHLDFAHRRTVHQEPSTGAYTAYKYKLTKTRTFPLIFHFAKAFWLVRILSNVGGW